MWFTLCFAVFGAQTELAPKDLIWRSHFIGTQAMTDDTNFAYLKAMWKLEQTQLFFQKAQHGIIRHMLGGSPKEIDDKLRGGKFFQQILSSESHFEVWNNEGKAAEWLLALKQSDAQADSFKAELLRLIKPWQLTSQSDPGNSQTKLWAVKKNGSETAAFLARLGGWTVLYRGIEPSHYTAFETRLRKGVTPSSSTTQNWFEFSLNLPQLVPTLGISSSAKLPNPLPCLVGSLSTQKSMVKTQVRLLYATPQTWNLDSWNLPLHIMRDPLVSFTAMRGVQDWIGKFKFPGDVSINPVPNQMFIWAQADVPYQTFAAVPLPKASNWIAQASSKIVPPANEILKKLVMGDIRWMANQSRIIWTGLPVLVPSIYASGTSNQFLAGDIFPAPLGTNLPPQELIDQVVNQKKLLYYDWEITQERLLQLQSISQWYDILTPNSSLNQEVGNTNSLAFTWIRTIAPYLGNAVTEINIVSPQELSLKRSSHCGFSGIELLLLSRWMNEDYFPVFVPPTPNGK